MIHLKTFEENSEEEFTLRRLKTIERYKKSMSSLTFDEAIIYIENHCTEWIKNPYKIIRGLDIRDVNNITNYFISAPVKRFSKDNKNFYTMIMDNAPKWKYYPKRSNSFCCGTKYNRYGNKSYIVIPEDDSLWAIAPKHDLWISFEYNIRKYFYGFNTIKNIFSIIDKLAKKEFNIELSDENYKDFKKYINLLQEKIHNLSNNAYNILIDELEENSKSLTIEMLTRLNFRVYQGNYQGNLLFFKYDIRQVNIKRKLW
jgi:hypothetical protein